ncbi:GNAT family N-acetyltransferase [Flavobacterium seoulense]|uniref:GNAT family acetyltransferase n=1 Tax=Flavobacterium seoulense TaxID=1492738 RepID=A0A066WSX1_9FLAO|nr:GNAT family N-acetyltransferase [Flavobacterium seoulense]KDN53770.1 GNAT family acetyltransferase [Flavobacterium seoulense]
MDFKQINGSTGEDNKYSNQFIADFLHTHLEEFGDPVDDILECIAYVMHPEKGGNIILAIDNEEIVGAVILNNTGMKRFIPENILVYIAVDNNKRGKGYGKSLMQKAISITDGAIALHVEPNNPARKLYEKLGFTNKYLEMRLIK